MAQPAFIQKTLRMKPEVSKIFDDLDNWLDYCRFNLISFNPADMYRSQDYWRFQQEKDYLGRKARRDAKLSREK
jgi:hypothetical protein